MYILIVYIVTRYMYDAVRWNFALSATFLLECFDGSEVTTREGNELVDTGLKELYLPLLVTGIHCTM